MADWDRRFMELARHIGGWSKDRSRRVGCIIVGPHNDIRATGYNGFPRGIDDDAEARHQRPEKYRWTEHAERNAIYNAARTGVALQGCRLFLPWFPCMDCARAVIQTGLIEIVCLEPDFGDPQWGDEFRSVFVLLNEAKIPCRFWKE